MAIIIDFLGHRFVRFVSHSAVVGHLPHHIAANILLVAPIGFRVLIVIGGDLSGEAPFFCDI